MPLDAATLPSDDPFSQFNTPSSPILFAVGERDVGWKKRDGNYQHTNDHKAIIRMNQAGDAARLLAVVGTEYKLVHNKELFTRVEDTMRKSIDHRHLSGVQVKDKVAHFGRICYRDYVFPNMHCRVGDHDVAFRVIVQNGYGGSALRFHAGGIDFFCTNGMVRGEFSTAYHKHTKGLMVEDLSATINKSLLTFSLATDQWQRWAITPVAAHQVTTFFEKIASSAKLKDSLSEQYMQEAAEQGKTLWSVYSTLTHYASHNEGAFKLRKINDDFDSAAASMMKREVAVSRWITTPEWEAMEMAS